MNNLLYGMKKATYFSISHTHIIGWFLCGLLLFYNFHKYLFQYGDIGTSPTYSDTPFIWKFAKYGIFLILCIYLLFIYKLRLKLNTYNWIFCAFIIGHVFSIIIYFICTNEALFDEFEICIWFILYLILLTIDKKFILYLVTALNKHLKLFIVILLIGNIIVVCNYLIWSRLPALGYEDGFVRFGSFWDDPNGFGFLCAAVLPTAIKNKWKIISAGLILSILLTVSFSSFINLLFSIILLGYAGMNRVNYKYALLFLLLLSIIIVLSWHFRNFLTSIYELKQASVDDHTAFSSIPFHIIAPLSSAYAPFETWYWRYLLNFTPFSIIGIVFIVIYWIKKLLSSSRDLISIYIILFILGNLFIPLIFDFPLNLLFLISLALDQRRDDISYVSNKRILITR